jgi:hypothetical protein
MKTVSGTFQGKISGGGGGTPVLLIAGIVAAVLFGGAVVGAVVAFIHLVLEVCTMVGAATLTAGAGYVVYRLRARKAPPAIASPGGCPSCGPASGHAPVTTGHVPALPPAQQHLHLYGADAVAEAAKHFGGGW